MTNYRKILRLHSLRINNIEITPRTRLCARNSVIPPCSGRRTAV